MSKILTHLLLTLVSGTCCLYVFYKHVVLNQSEPSLGDGITNLISAVLWFYYGRNLIRSKWMRCGYAALMVCGAACTLALFSFAGE